MRIVTCRNLGQAPLGVWIGQSPLELLPALFVRLLRLISQLAGQPSASPIFECPTCPELPIELFPLDPFSVFMGIFVGPLIGPMLDLLHLVRQSWKVWLALRLARLEKTPAEGRYRLL